MNRLRKIIRWLWLIKERVVLATVVAVLCYRVYKVINPDEPESGSPVRLAGKSLPPDWVGPNTPPPVPQPSPDQLWSTLWSRNMMTYSRVGARGPSDNADTEVQIKVLRIQETTRKGLRAQISTGGRRGKWYSVGEKFETFELVSIDEESKCVEIWSGSTREQKEYCIE